jgi:hypothetical protein
MGILLHPLRERAGNMVSIRMEMWVMIPPELIRRYGMSPEGRGQTINSPKIHNYVRTSHDEACITKLKGTLHYDSGGDHQCNLC